MALNLTKFKADLKTALLKAQAKNQKDGVSTDTAMGNLADEIATEVDKYIKTLTLTIATGVVQVEGTAAAQANVVPIVVNNGVS